MKYLLFFVGLNLGLGLQASEINSQVNSQIDRYVQSLTDERTFSGAVLVAQNGNVLLCKGYGNANYEHRIPNTPDTKFRIASITKQFTAAAILHLEERGLLKRTDTIDRFIPDFPNGSAITLHHLMTHSSGIINYTTLDEYWKSATTELPHETTINRFKNKPVNFAPGERAEYNNSGYVLLAYIIEEVTQQSFITYLTKHFFEPIGMTHTGFAALQTDISEHATGYIAKDGAFTLAQKVDMMQQSGAGFLYSTVEDLYRWHQALQNKKVVSKAITKALTSPHVDIGIFKQWYGKYGYGLLIDTMFDHKRVFHIGAIKGFMSQMDMYLEDDVCIIILSNLESFDRDAMLSEIARIIFDKTNQYPK